jgi:hypothetical protein
LPQIVGAGADVFDFDSDGVLDLSFRSFYFLSSLLSSCCAGRERI